MELYINPFADDHDYSICYKQVKSQLLEIKSVYKHQHFQIICLKPLEFVGHGSETSSKG